MIIHGAITDQVIGAFYRAYNGIGFGYAENICRSALVVELQFLRIAVAREVPIEVVHRGVPIGRFRLDLVVDECVLVEVKATKGLIDADRRQIQSYLKATSIEVGLLFNFGPKPERERFIYTNERK
jgi:GxxExxY protein